MYTVRIVSGGGARLSLSTGVNETVHDLFLGDTEQRKDTYGSTGSAADYTSDVYFEGTGVLEVQRDNSGKLIYVR